MEFAHVELAVKGQTSARAAEEETFALAVVGLRFVLLPEARIERVFGRLIALLV